MLLGAKAIPQPLPFVLNNIIVRYNAEQALYLRKHCGGWTNIGVHPDGSWSLMTGLSPYVLETSLTISVNDIANPQDPSSWKFQLLMTWPGVLSAEENTNAGRLRLIKDKCHDWVDFRRLAMEWLHDEIDIPTDRYASWSPVPWDSHDGRVTMIGDAVHAIPFRKPLSARFHNLD